MSILGVIPARYGSTRLPGKSLIDLCGKPLIQWVYERASQASGLAGLFVATDDERIRRVVLGFGGQAVMTRADHPSGTDRVAEAAEGLDADIVINIQGDEPLIDPALIDELGTVLRLDDRWDMATAASPIREVDELHNPSVVKVVWGQDQQALYFSRSVIPHVRDPEPGRAWLHWRHMGIYAYRRRFLRRLVQAPPCELERAEKLEQLRALHLGCRMYVAQTAHAALGVDTPADIPIAEAKLREAGLAG